MFEYGRTTDGFGRVTVAEKFRVKNEQRMKQGWQTMNSLHVQPVQSDSVGQS